MVINSEAIQERLRELDSVLEELSHYKGKGPEDFRASLSLRWIVERGMIAAANLVFDVTDHILAGEFGTYPDTFEDSLRFLAEKDVIDSSLYQRLKGLGGFRNILVHEYAQVNLELLHDNFVQAFDIFPSFSSQIQLWLERRTYS